MTRIQDIASLIPVDAGCVADIGYDHGKLIELLASTHRQARIIGVEMQPAASERFWGGRDADPSLRSRVELLCGDGLEPLKGRGVDVIVIAGLGERSIADMLTRSQPILSGLRGLVLSPMGTTGVLRRRLREMSWSVVENRLSRQKGRFYLTCAAEPGVRSIDEATWLFGTDLFEQNHPLLLDFLTHLRSRCEPVIQYHKDDQEWIRSFYESINRAIAVARNTKM